MGNDGDYQHGGAGHHSKQGQLQDRFRGRCGVFEITQKAYRGGTYWYYLRSEEGYGDDGWVPQKKLEKSYCPA